ncbi:hypothetical protein H2201_005975 [Coniosporium apollinis]|uniref:Uncharacterized protein n=1 Tax=Coniosporium apollinis TaxID=61459 RepID=A0ABQ9NRK5_9PEZI|nr:hypothetical protein H2201_005975 [Coniosporium apollinis]
MLDTEDTLSDSDTSLSDSEASGSDFEAISAKPEPSDGSTKIDPFPFMKLSAELRTQIYKHILVDPSMIWYFLSQIGRVRAWLKTIWIVGPHHSRHAFAAYTLLAQCTRLNHLSIDCEGDGVSPGESAKVTAKGFYQDAFPWLEAVGVAKGDHLAALGILVLDDEIDSWFEQYYYQDKY